MKMCQLTGDILQVPASPVFPNQILIRFLTVSDAKGVGIPLDPMAHAQSDVTELICLCEWSRVTEVTWRLLPGLDRHGPIFVDLLAAPFPLRRRREFVVTAGEGAAARGITALR